MVTARTAVLMTMSYLMDYIGKDEIIFDQPLGLVQSTEEISAVRRNADGRIEVLSKDGGDWLGMGFMAVEDILAVATEVSYRKGYNEKS